MKGKNTNSPVFGSLSLNKKSIYCKQNLYIHNNFTEFLFV